MSKDIRRPLLPNPGRVTMERLGEFTSSGLMFDGISGGGGGKGISVSPFSIFNLD